MGLAKYWFKLEDSQMSLEKEVLQAKHEGRVQFKELTIHYST